MLFHYLDHKRKESSSPLHATYLVSGKFEDNGLVSHKVSIVREDQLEGMKSKMSLVVSVHVYSVQKALLKDSGPLYAVDYDAVRDNLTSCSRHSAIRCAGAVPMSSLELQQAREVQRAASPEPETKNASMNGNGAPAPKPPTKPQKGIMGLFANKASLKNPDGGKEIKSEIKGDAPPVDVPKSKPAAKTNPMLNFFGNQATKKPEKTVKEKEPARPSSPTEQRHQSLTQPGKKQAAGRVEPEKESKKDCRSKTKRIEDSDSEEEKMEKKKRRRIKKPEPDSSDEDVIPDSPQKVEPRIPSPAAKKPVEAAPHPPRENSEVKVRKRRRVLKSQTFVDEEGCIVTEKGYESESYSEAEEDVSACRDPAPARPPTSKKEEEKKSQKRTSANASKGTKQASIMGFFQKK
ncbi:DNA polymerase delta subunit 3 isoform 2-T2 [Aulostomus maculatus]